MSRAQDAARATDAVSAHAPALLAYFARRVDPPHEAADLLAETLLIVWRRIGALPASDDEVRPWMFGVARNVLLHHRRRAVRQRSVVDRLRSVLAGTEHPGFADPFEHDELHAALRELDAVDRDIIALVHGDGFSLADAAKLLRMNDATVRSRYHRARARLRTSLESASPTAPSVTSARQRE